MLVRMLERDLKQKVPRLRVVNAQVENSRAVYSFGGPDEVRIMLEVVGRYP